MANGKASISSGSVVMNGGDGPYSYAQNSSYQRGKVDSVKTMIKDEIATKLDVKKLFSSSNLFRIADLGCSVGPNTFLVVQNIIEAVELKHHQSPGLSSDILELQVFFNDHVSNDFNILFSLLDPNRRYFVAGVPGSFHGRIFPEASLHFVHSSFALQWLSKVPKEVLDKGSSAWNKGKIHYTNAPSEVLEAYSAQYAKDIESFLCARAQELVCGGLMVLLIPCLPIGTTYSEGTVNLLFDLLGSCLMDMAKLGLLNEAEVDSFNLPIYVTPQEEVKALVEKNGCFSIERMEQLATPKKDVAAAEVRHNTLHFRAGFEGLIKEHFGCKIIDELFDRFSQNVMESSILSNNRYCELFILLKRKGD